MLSEFDREDKRRFWREFFFGAGLGPLVGGVVVVGFLGWLSGTPIPLFRLPITFSILLLAVCVMISAIRARRAMLAGVFHHHHLRMLWDAAKDRYGRLDTAISDLKKERMGDFSSLQETMKNVMHSVFVSLRRADRVLLDLAQTESGLSHTPTVRSASSPGRDKQVQELYQLADRNKAEYRHRIAKVQNGVRRTEAQAEVYVTTLDSLRAQLLSLRLSGVRPEQSHRTFVDVIQSAKRQLEEVDRALQELEQAEDKAQAELNWDDLLGQSTPPLPEDAARSIDQGDGH